MSNFARTTCLSTNILTFNILTRSVLPLLLPAASLALSACAPASGERASPADEGGAFGFDGPELAATHGPSGLGLRVGPLGAQLAVGEARIGLHTTAWGDSQGVEPVGAGALELVCDEQARCGDGAALHFDGLSELWEPHTYGFEQSWIVDQPRGDDDTLVLDVAVDGAEIRTLPGQPGVWLDGGDGGLIQYAGLTVLDADGLELPARLVAEGDTLRIVADVAGAAWPVVVDPVLTSATWTGVGSASWDTFGHALASGDFNGDGQPDLAVAANHNWGCPSDSSAGAGKVYVYYNSSSGLGVGTTTTTLTAPSSSKCFADTLAAGDFNGDGVAELAVGAPGNDSFRGSIYLYKGVLTSGLESSATTTLNGTTRGEEFGSYLSSGDLFNDGIMDLAVGVDKPYTGTDRVTGRVSLYRGTSTGSLLSTCRTINGVTTGSRFGGEVLLRDVGSDGAAEVLVGAVNTGLVRVYSVRNCTTTPSYTTLSKPSGLLYFGGEIEVLYNGSTPYADIMVHGETSAGVGRVYRFAATSSGIGTTASSSYLSDGVASTWFGTQLQALDLDLDGYTDLAVSAYGADSYAGRVYVYDNDAGSLSLGTTLYGPASGGHFGEALAAIDDSVASLVVGAHLSSVAVGESMKDTNGAATVYTGY